jgi:hypothetical protein
VRELEHFGRRAPASDYRGPAAPGARNTRRKARRNADRPGSSDFPDELTTNTIRLDKTERLLLLSDSLTDPTVGLGLAVIERAIAKADNNAAPGTLRATEDALREAHPDDLDDDATIISSRPAA